jgi:hypothetical protein
MPGLIDGGTRSLLMIIEKGKIKIKTREGKVKEED